MSLSLSESPNDFEEIQACLSREVFPQLQELGVCLHDVNVTFVGGRLRIVTPKKNHPLILRVFRKNRENLLPMMREGFILVDGGEKLNSSQVIPQTRKAINQVTPNVEVDDFLMQRVVIESITLRN